MASWEAYRPSAAYLTAMDIVGFSRRLSDASALFATRTALIRAIEETALFQRESRSDAVTAHFLGDEIRLAFLADTCEAGAVIDFATSVIRNLREKAVTDPSYRTDVVAVVLAGYLTSKSWQGCRYLEGAVAFKAQRWMDTKQLKAGELGIDADFQGRLTARGVGWHEASFGTDRGWVKHV